MKIYWVQIGDTVMEMTAEEYKAYCKAMEKEEANKYLKEQTNKQTSSQKNKNLNKSK